MFLPFTMNWLITDIPNYLDELVEMSLLIKNKPIIAPNINGMAAWDTNLYHIINPVKFKDHVKGTSRENLVP